MAHVSLRALQLVLQFRDLKRREHVALMNTVANIDLDPSDVTGYFGVKIDLLIWLELSCYSQRTG
jgi:hypothetical protein